MKLASNYTPNIGEISFDNSTGEALVYTHSDDGVSDNWVTIDTNNNIVTETLTEQVEELTKRLDRLINQIAPEMDV